MTVIVTCPLCKHELVATSDAGYTVENMNQCTLDCSNCNELLIVVNGSVYPFHEYINSLDSRWPKDGAGTSCLELELGDRG